MQGNLEVSGDSITSLGAAPDDAEYLVGAADGDLSAERVVTDTTSITWDLATAGQAKAKRAALTGDVTASADSNTTAIADNAVTNTDIRDSGALSVIGRAANSSGDPADISATAASDAVLRESGSVLGFGTVATGGIANDAVTYAKMQNVSAASRIIGRGSAAGAGDPEELTVGSGLSLSGTALSATAPGSDTQVIFNDGGSTLGADAGLTYNKTTDALTIAGKIAVSGTNANVIGGSADTVSLLRLTGSLTSLVRTVTVDTTMTPGLNTNAVGFYFNPTFVEHSSGTHSAFNGMLVSPVITAGAANVTNLNGLNISGMTAAGGTTNAALLKIGEDNVTGATNNYAIWVANGLFRHDGGQIQFPASQNASTDANTFDDYEEGTWTPVIGGSTSESGQTYAQQTGAYTKIGRQVICTFLTEFTNKGTITGNVQVKGLPFTVGAAAYMCIAWQSLATSWVEVGAVIIASSTTADLRGATAAATSSTLTDLATGDIGNSSVFRGTLIYTV